MTIFSYLRDVLARGAIPRAHSPRDRMGGRACAWLVRDICDSGNKRHRRAIMQQGWVCFNHIKLVAAASPLGNVDMVSIVLRRSSQRLEACRCAERKADGAWRNKICGTSGEPCVSRSRRGCRSTDWRKKNRQLWQPAKTSKVEIWRERETKTAGLRDFCRKSPRWMGWRGVGPESESESETGARELANAPAEEASEWQSRGQTEGETHNLGTLVDWLCRFDKKNNLDGVVDSRVGAGKKGV